MMSQHLDCSICQSASVLLDVVDLNKSCHDLRFPLAGIPVYYAQCSGCGFCFAPELASWSLSQFEVHIYNNDYVLFDPEYVDIRPRANAENLIRQFGDRAHSIKHLDYGGGAGLLTQLLTESNWQSTSFDPFVDRDTDVTQLGKFDLITAFEVFEHVPDVPQLMHHLRSLLAPNGIVLFSTLLSDGHIHPGQRLSWWYASPRNGHISLFSKQSLTVLAQNYGFTFGSFSVGFHAFFTHVEPWAQHLIRKQITP